MLYFLVWNYITKLQSSKKYDYIAQKDTGMNEMDQETNNKLRHAQSTNVWQGNQE